MKQTNSHPSTVQLVDLMDNPKVLISHLYAIGMFGGLVSDMLEILANHNLDSFYEEVAYYLPKKEMPAVGTIRDDMFGIDLEEMYALDQMEEAERWEAQQAEKELNSHSEGE